MAKTITDKWPIRYMRLDDEVFGAVAALKAEYGSYNKGLRAVLLPHDGVSSMNLEKVFGQPSRITDQMIQDVAPVKQPPHCTTLDAVGPQVSGGKGKISHESWKGPLLKPSEKK